MHDEDKNKYGSFSWLKQEGDFQGHENLFGFEIDPDSLPDITKEEFLRLLGEERTLRRELRRNGLHGFEQTAEQIVKMAKTMNIQDLLLAWALAHAKNRAYIRKRKEGDIMITSTSQLLLQAAELLKH